MGLLDFAIKDTFDLQNIRELSAKKFLKKKLNEKS